MTITYNTLTLGQLIEKLRELPPDAGVRGLGAEVDSYRGYYERNAIEPSGETIFAHDLADRYADQIGKPIHGYKGGDYEVSSGENVYLADYGRTGPNICGLILNGRVYEPLLVEVNEW